MEVRRLWADVIVFLLLVLGDMFQALFYRLCDVALVKVHGFA
jgi:hypothetical protein